MNTQGNFPSGHPQGAIVHFTAGGPSGPNTVQGGIANGFCFFVIAPSGEVFQNFDLNRWGYHAGKSSHQKLGNSVSRFLVGIEVCNAGKVRQLDSSTFRPWFNDPLHYQQAHEPIPAGVPNPTRDFKADAVRFVEQRHNREAGWYHKYTPEQEQALTTLILWLKNNAPDIFQFELVLGHDEVSPGRKNDPGGALSLTMPEYRAHLQTLLVAGGSVPLPDTSHTEVAGPAPVVASQPRLRYAPDTFLPEVLSFQKAANRYPGLTLVEDGYAGGKTSEAFQLLSAYYLHGDPRATDKPSPPPADAPAKNTKAAPAASAAGTAQRRTKIAAKIVDWEARRDSKGRIAIYKLPGNDGGGSYEVAGINEKYHSEQAKKLADLINANKHAQAESLAAEYIAQYTDSVAKITKNAGTEAFLRDTAFNRGPTGAVKILQVAMNVSVTGKLGDDTRAAFERLEKDTPVELLQRLRNAREEYERKYIGYRANFWPGLTNRWNNAHLFALELLKAEGATAAAEAKLATSSEADLILTGDLPKPLSEPQEAHWPPLSYGPERYNVVAERFQEYANAAAKTNLEEDGMAGQKTSDAFKLLTGYLLAGDPRLG